MKRSKEAGVISSGAVTVLWCGIQEDEDDAATTCTCCRQQSVNQIRQAV